MQDAEGLTVAFGRPCPGAEHQDASNFMKALCTPRPLRYHLACGSSLAAARSRNHTSFPSVGSINLAGYCSPGTFSSSTEHNTAALSVPLTRKATSRAALMSG